MRKLILLIFLQLISSILCRQKTNLDWLEPIEMKLKEKEVRYLQKFTTTEEPIEVISLGPDIEIINSECFNLPQLIVNFCDNWTQAPER